MACGQICHSFAGGQEPASRVLCQNERKCNNYRNLSQFLDLISPGGGSNLVRGDNPAASVARPAFNNYFF